VVRRVVADVVDAVVAVDPDGSQAEDRLGAVGAKDDPACYDFTHERDLREADEVFVQAAAGAFVEVDSQYVIRVGGIRMAGGIQRIFGKQVAGRCCQEVYRGSAGASCERGVHVGIIKVAPRARGGV